MQDHSENYTVSQKKCHYQKNRYIKRSWQYLLSPCKYQLPSMRYDGEVKVYASKMLKWYD